MQSPFHALVAAHVAGDAGQAVQFPVQAAEFPPDPFVVGIQVAESSIKHVTDRNREIEGPLVVDHVPAAVARDEVGQDQIDVGDGRGFQSRRQADGAEDGPEFGGGPEFFRRERLDRGAEVRHRG